MYGSRSRSSFFWFKFFSIFILLAGLFCGGISFAETKRELPRTGVPFKNPKRGPAPAFPIDNTAVDHDNIASPSDLSSTGRTKDNESKKSNQEKARAALKALAEDRVKLTDPKFKPEVIAQELSLEKEMIEESLKAYNLATNDETRSEALKPLIEALGINEVNKESLKHLETVAFYNQRAEAVSIMDERDYSEMDPTAEQSKILQNAVKRDPMTQRYFGEEAAGGPLQQHQFRQGTRIDTALAKGNKAEAGKITAQMWSSVRNREKIVAEDLANKETSQNPVLQQMKVMSWVYQQSQKNPNLTASSNRPDIEGALKEWKEVQIPYIKKVQGYRDAVAKGGKEGAEAAESLRKMYAGTSVESAATDFAFTDTRAGKTHLTEALSARADNDKLLIPINKKLFVVQKDKLQDFAEAAATKKLEGASAEEPMTVSASTPVQDLYDRAVNSTKEFQNLYHNHSLVARMRLRDPSGGLMDAMAGGTGAQNKEIQKHRKQLETDMRVEYQRMMSDTEKLYESLVLYGEKSPRPQDKESDLPEVPKAEAVGKETGESPVVSVFREPEYFVGRLITKKERDRLRDLFKSYEKKD